MHCRMIFCKYRELQISVENRQSSCYPHFPMYGEPVYSGRTNLPIWGWFLRPTPSSPSYSSHPLIYLFTTPHIPTSSHPPHFLIPLAHAHKPYALSYLFTRTHTPHVPSYLIALPHILHIPSYISNPIAPSRTYTRYTPWSVNGCTVLESRLRWNPL